MKIVIASDSFKGSLSSTALADVAERVARTFFSPLDVVKIAMADGGEGTVAALLQNVKGKKIHTTVHSPAYEQIQAEYGVLNEDSAVLEMAAASGITLVSDEKRSIRKLNTFGTGELILNAIERGCTSLYMGIGGSATNDGGLGMLSALGVRFLDANNNEVPPFPEHFLRIATIDASRLNPKVQQANITIMCDVTNPLLGDNGATKVFGKQKGATAEDIDFLEQGLRHLYSLVEKKYGTVIDTPGAGAAGGLGAAFLAFTKAELRSGISTILDLIDFENTICDADFVLTGEGRMDAQSAQGKVAYGVGMACKKHNIPCFAIVGGIEDGYEAIYDAGITSVISCIRQVSTLDEVMAQSEMLYADAVERLCRILGAGC